MEIRSSHHRRRRRRSRTHTRTVSDTSAAGAGALFRADDRRRTRSFLSARHRGTPSAAASLPYFAASVGRAVLSVLAGWLSVCRRISHHFCAPRCGGVDTRAGCAPQMQISPPRLGRALHGCAACSDVSPVQRGGRRSLDPRVRRVPGLIAALLTSSGQTRQIKVSGPAAPARP